jgi:glycogen debranching enzyme
VRRYWRGPTWINAAWLLWLGMVRLGYEDEARELVSRLSDAVLREGLREYYHPHTGRGLGARDFAWTSLIVEMAAPYDQGDGLTGGDMASLAARQRGPD